MLLVFSIILILVLNMFCFLHFVPLVHSPSQVGWVDRYSFSKDNGDGTYTWTGNIGPQVFWDNKTNDWQELEFVKNDTYPYFITWASVANTTYFVRNSHIALEITNVSYVKLWNPDYTAVSVYSERWVVEYWKTNSWKDTGVGTQSNAWSVSQDSNSVNITRIQKLVGVGELNVTYSVRKGTYLKHTIVFKSLDSGGGTYRVLMQWAGITNSKVKTDSEEFVVTAETHKVVPYFLIGENSTSMVVQEYLESVYPNLMDIVFNIHAQGIKADVILANWTLALNGELMIDPDTSTFDVVSNGYVSYGGTDYAAIQSASTGNYYTTNIMLEGQKFVTPNCYVYRVHERFNTSSLAGATISSATLCLGGFADYSTVDFVIRLQNWTDGDDGINTDDYSKFDGTNYDDGLFSSSSWNLTAYNNITITNFTLINTVGGNTDICIRSYEDISASAPTGSEYVQFDCTGDPQPSKLEVTYTPSTVPEYDYVDSQTNVDSSADKGTHSSFTAQKATDWTNDTLIEANTNTTALNNAENFVDANDSNIDSHTGHGTSSNFTAQQDALIAYNDTLTEANTGGATSDVFTDGFEDGTFGKWDGNGATTWTNDGGICTNSSNLEGWASTSHSGTYYAGTGATGDGNLVSDNLDLSGVTSFGVQFWYAVDDTDGAGELVLKYWDGAAYDTIADLSGNAEDTWTFYSAIITDNQYFDATFRIDFLAACGSNEAVYIDDVVINKTMSANYELDYEFSWTTTDYDEANEYLCIRTNSYSGTVENLGVDVWDGSWKSISNALVASQWNNISITTNLTGATIYFRFIGKTESSDTAQNTWVIECNLIHTWSVGVNYELDLEEQFSSANFSRTSVELCARMGAYNTTENLRLDYWNASASAWIVAVATLTTNDWNNVSVKAYTSNASVTFTVRFVGVTESGDTEHSAWDKDACLLHTWDAAIAGLVAVLSQSILLPAYNALAKELGFQSSSLIIPSGAGYFWKSLPFQVTGTIKFYEFTTIYRALAFLATGIVTFFSSLSKTMELNFQPSVSIVPSSTNYFLKAIGFQTANTVQSFSSVTMQKALGFLTSGTSNLFASMSKASALSFQSGNSILPSGTTYLSKALGFQTSAMVVPSSMSYFGKALGVQATSMIGAFDSTSMLKGMGFLSTELGRVFDYGSMSKEVGFQVVEVQRAENIFPSSATYFWKAIGFQPTNTIIPSSTGYFWKAIGLQPSETIKAYDSSIMQKAIGFLSAGATNVYSTILRGIELGFTPTSILYPFAYGSSGKETATILIDRFELAKLFDNVEMLKALGFRTTGLLNLFDSSAMSKAIGLLTSETVNPYDASTFLKAKGFLAVGNVNLFSTVLRGIEVAFQSFGTVKLWESSSMLKAIGFQFSDSIRLFDGNLFGKGLLFQPSQTINMFAGFQVAKEQLFTILNVFQYEPIYPSASLFENKAIQFSVLGEITRFFSSLSSNLGREFFNYDLIHPLAFTSQSRGLQFGLDGLIRVFSDSPMGKAISFLATGTSNIWSSILKGMSLAFQPSGIVKLWDSNIMLKALGFQVNGATKLFDSATMLKALGFSITDVLKTVDSLSSSFEIYQYIPQNFYFTLTDIVKMFSGISFNMAKGFGNYDVIHPSGFLIENKAIGFNVDGIVRLFSDVSIGIEKAFSNFAILNPYSILTMNKALGFNAYELPLFFDYLGMGKSIRITTFEFLNTELIRFSSTLTMGKSVFIAFAETLFDNLNIQSLMIPIGQIVLVGPGIPASSFWKILALFSIVMLMASGVFLVEKQQKTKQSQSQEYQ